MAIIGYARVSTDGQSVAAQVAALAMFMQPYAGSNALFHGLPLSLDGQRAGGMETAPKIGEHNGKV